jgi:hypothetical protein
MLCAFGLDVLDPAVTPRRIWVLAQRLPPWARSLGEPWSPEADLAALIIDHLAQLTWVTLRAAGAQNVPRPTPLPRPPRTPARRDSAAPPASQPGNGRSASWADAARTLAAIPGVRVTDG